MDPFFHTGLSISDSLKTVRKSVLIYETIIHTMKKPSYYLLSQAMDGDEKAIEKILAFYDPYISKCCLRPLYDEYGNVYIVVDMELKGLIREALIKMILGFDIALEIEEE